MELNWSLFDGGIAGESNAAGLIDWLVVEDWINEFIFISANEKKWINQSNQPNQ